MRSISRYQKILIFCLAFAILCAWTGTAVMRLSKDFCNKNLYAGRSLNVDDRARITPDMPVLWITPAPIVDAPREVTLTAAGSPVLVRISLLPAADVSRSPPDHSL